MHNLKYFSTLSNSLINLLNNREMQSYYKLSFCLSMAKWSGFITYNNATSAIQHSQVRLDHGFLRQRIVVQILSQNIPYARIQPDRVPNYYLMFVLFRQSYSSQRVWSHMGTGHVRYDELNFLRRLPPVLNRYS